jgi:hypothetical protein
MGSRYWRTLGMSFVVGTILEYLVCFAISYYFNDRNQYLYALLIMLALWSLQIALWLKNTVVTTLYYYLVGKQKWVAEVETALRHNEFPIYDQYMPDATDYFNKVMIDPQSSLEQITYSAATIGQLEGLKLMKPTQAWRTIAVCEAAIDSYRRNPAPLKHRRRST